MRAIHTKVRAAEFRDALEFDVRWATRPDDLIQAFNETQPQVVHFSGHGHHDGLMLVGNNGEPWSVSVDALVRLFRIFGKHVRVVVLSACHTRTLAEAIVHSVDCVIGMRGPLDDEAASTFNASFYRAVAFGRSVAEAFEQAKLALSLEVPDAALPDLLAKDTVDPERLVLVPAFTPETRHFSNVGYSNRSFGLFYFRNYDVGTLIISGRQAEFQGENRTVRIEHVLEVTHGRNSGDVFANWVKIRYGVRSCVSFAYFSRQTTGGNFWGGSDDLFTALHAMIEPPAEKET